MEDLKNNEKTIKQTNNRPEKQMDEQLSAGHLNQIHELLQNNNASKLQKPKGLLRLRDNKTEHLVAPEKIIRIDVIGDLITVELSNKDKIFVTSNLKCFEHKLYKMGFVRINRQTLVNLFYVSSIKMRKGLRFLIVDGEELAITRRRWAHVKEVLGAIQL